MFSAKTSRYSNDIECNGEQVLPLVGIEKKRPGQDGTRIEEEDEPAAKVNWRARGKSKSTMAAEIKGNKDLLSQSRQAVQKSEAFAELQLLPLPRG